MLGKTAGGLFWMFRYLERAENTARMIDAGLRISLTRSSAAESEWTSILSSTGLSASYAATHGAPDGPKVIDFLLRDPNNAGSIMAGIEAARMNARVVRTALTREVWEAVNECYMVLKRLLSHPVQDRDLPRVLQVIRQRSAIVRGALHGTMVRNDIYNFARIGTFYERADNTARILDQKYYILLPSVRLVGSPSDNVQWETILRATSTTRAYQTLHEGDIDPKEIAEFLILDGRLPRSLAFCYGKIGDNLGYLEQEYGTRHTCQALADALCARFRSHDMNAIFDYGLHEFITDFLRDSASLGRQIEIDYRFIE
ncbi:alpha-E domain-containing protein [uncultured Tateyamaria sp.]|uniref:alpha-E domain-containing protein n=1 Tax=uncultured Tateyamaria sp. TaxID=455651 RepID=UPI00261C8D28|nr:alpha-E domain-containing protein [uncultured Tateyamaria sp.]